ncbi:hypothetical protein [Inconstantimicrobium mannanitabidum]|uniref:Uncharacterized protein n=1 Tax=Inconstantimicrobium mannanitabidum TaxID=1604901 RepID=A0ACB5R6V1_9CLOT|nr:hypothetical protein [Clostridium sp. TW13]GKX64759.1 hypothetical protein rsdtw13_00170 [Clostridium sp. TW13]
MLNLDDLLLKEAKKAIKSLNKEYCQISTIKIIEKMTGTRYSPQHSTNNIGLSGFLSIHQKELGIEYLNTEFVTIDEIPISTTVWRVI